MNPILGLIIANLIWGAASPIFKFALENIPPFTLAFIRFFFAALLFFPFVNWRELRKIGLREWLEIIVGGAFFGVFLNITFFFLAIQKTASINAPIIGSTGPIFLFIFSVLILREPLNKKILFGMFVSFVGALVIVFSPLLFDGKGIGEVGALEGNLMLVLATVGSVTSTVIMKNTLKKISPLLVVAISFLLASIMFFPFIIPELKVWSLSQLNVVGWTGILFGVFLSSALAYFLYYYGLSKLHAQEVGVFAYIDPVVAVLIAAPLLHEYPNLYFILGSLLVFGGIYISEGRIHWHPLNKIKN